MQTKPLIANTLRGFAIGTADLVPGVSGGTIALLLGIYNRLIETIAQMVAGLTQLLRGNASQAEAQFKELPWLFILSLIVGIVAAVFSLAPLMSWLLEQYPEEMAGVFSGIVLAAIATAWQTSRHNAQSKFHPLEVLVAAAVAAGLFVLLGISAEPHADPTLIIFFGSGALAICAMVLPGISGSFLLLIIGMYGSTLEAVSDRELQKLLVLLAGAVVGLAVFTPWLKLCLNSAPRITNSVLLGLLVGSLRVLWPWPDGVGVVSEDSNKAIDGTKLQWPTWEEAWLPILLGIGFGALIFVLSRLKPANPE